MSRRLIVVSNRLPVRLVKGRHEIIAEQTDGGLVSALKSYLENAGVSGEFSSVVWIGSAEFEAKNWQRYKRQESGNMPFEIMPIFLDKKLYSKFYNGFCNATLWPLFHYFPSFVEFEKDTFIAYEKVNTLFSEKIQEVMKPGDVVWIHDYQLMLLPGLIRDRFPEVTIGYFLHIPFPSYELFRMLHKPWKEKIITGLLGADLIGFHTHEYVQHFLKSVQMIKGIDYQFRSIAVPGRTVKAEMFPLGIDFDKFHQAADHPEVISQKQAVIKSFPDKKIIFSVDRLDYTKGITHRLQGFEQFLEANPEWRQKVIFVLVVVPSRQIVSKYNERKKMIEEEIGRINGKFCTLDWQPIIYRYSHLSFTELAAMYDLADIGLITPLRDGMNLVAKEFVASKRRSGVLILSELAGAANEMSEALLVNPMDRQEVAEAILAALQMPEVIQENKIQILQSRLRDYSVVHWVHDFMRQLEEVKSGQQKQDTKFLTPDTADLLVDHYQHAKRRLLLLDYDGTLVGFSKHPQLATPTPTLIQLVKDLTRDAHTDVTIISGRDSHSLEKWFGHLDVHLVAEHGAALRVKGEGWRTVIDAEQEWKDVIHPLLKTFCQRSPGSFVEEKRNTLVWHYRNVDPELGFIRSRELLDSLHHLVRNSNLNVLDGNKVIEVKVSGVDKGAVARKLADEHIYDFVLAMGDDRTDEDMFKALPGSAYTIKVGTANTAAQFHLLNQHEVLSLLVKLRDTIGEPAVS